MKKILAMFVAFACTLGAFADVIQANISGTDFSTYPVGVFTPGLNDSGADDGTSFWYTGFADDLDAEVVNVSSNEETGVAVNYLAFESNVTNPLYRTVNNCYGFVEGETQDVPKKAVGDGLFIDTTVQFTPYLVNENHPAPTKTSDDDKIIVWVRETEFSEGVCETNLIVTAGYILGGANVEPKDYVVQMTPAEVSALCQGQHRLTIKAFDNITSVAGVTIMGFVVYIDGNAVSYDTEVAAFEAGASDLAVLKTTPALYYNNDAHKLFPSMVTPDQENTTGYSSITAVGFAGMGQIGEVWFDDYTTDYPAFAGDNLNFTVKVGNGVTSFEYLGNTYTETTTFAVAPGTVSIAITGVQYDIANGWSAKAGTWYTGNVKVENAGSADGDSGTFLFADGDVFTLAGFKANFEVVVGGETFEFETLDGNTAEDGALAAANGGTLKLLSDLSVAGLVFDESKVITIDLNGKTISGEGNITSTIVNFGTLTILDSSEEKTGKVLGYTTYDEGELVYIPMAIENYGNLTLNSGEFAVVYGPADEETGEEYGTIVINGGKFQMIIDEESLPESAEDFHLIGSIAEGLSAEMTVEEGVYYVTIGEAVVPATPVATIGETEYTSLAEAIAAATAESTIKIIADIDTDGAFVIQKTVTIDLNGYTIATTENDKSGDGVFWVKAGGLLTINDTVGTGVIDGVGGNGYNIGIWADGGKVIINGGNFTNEGATDDGPDGDHFDLIYAKNGGIVEITGGTFKCQTPKWTLNSYNLQNGTPGTFVVTGGKFYQYDPTDIDTDDQPVTNWCPAGYRAVSDNEGYFIVEVAPVATIGETEYFSLAEAIAAATAESTIKIIADIDTDGAFVIQKTVTIDLNGYTIATTENDKSGDGVFWVKAGGLLTINDTVGTGVIDGVGGNGYNIGIWADGGKVIINGGNFTNEGATDDGPDGDHFDLIYAKNGGIVEITGGTFKCQTPKWTLNSYNLQNGTPGTFVVTGGKFYQYDPTDIDTDDQPVTNWCPANYKATPDGDYYTVEMIPEVTVTLPVAPANTTLKAFVGEDEVAIVDNAITVLAGSSVVLELTAAEGYEFSKDVTVYTTEAAVVNENADWSSIVLPAVTAIVTDPWAPAAENDAAAQAKVAEIFGASAASITTYAQYMDLVTYVKGVKGDEFAPTSLTADEKLYIVDSLKLGAEKLFTAEPKVVVTSVTPDTTAGNWNFQVKVTEGEGTDAIAVATAKIEALVKVSTDLKTWGAAETTAEMVGKEVRVTVVNFGDGTTGFMKISE